MDLSKIIVIQESQSNGCECRCLKHHRHMVMSGFCFAFEVEFYQKKKKSKKQYTEYRGQQLPEMVSRARTHILSERCE